MATPAKGEPAPALRVLRGDFHFGPERPGVLFERLPPTRLSTPKSLRRNGLFPAQGSPVAGLSASQASGAMADARPGPVLRTASGKVIDVASLIG
jgi:hypothetical protein